jgi:hypothetical protein
MQPQINFNTSKTVKPLYIVDAQLAVFAEDPAEAQDKADQYLTNWISFQQSSVLVDGRIKALSWPELAGYFTGYLSGQVWEGRPEDDPHELSSALLYCSSEEVERITQEARAGGVNLDEIVFSLDPLGGSIGAGVLLAEVRKAAAAKQEAGKE